MMKWPPRVCKVDRISEIYRKSLHAYWSTPKQFDLMACFPGNFFSMNIHTWNAAFPYWSPIGFGLYPPHPPCRKSKIGVGPADFRKAWTWINWHSMAQLPSIKKTQLNRMGFYGIFMGFNGFSWDLIGCYKTNPMMRPWLWFRKISQQHTSRWKEKIAPGIPERISPTLKCGWWYKT